MEAERVLSLPGGEASSSFGQVPATAMAVAVFGQEPVTEGGHLLIYGQGDAACLAEDQAQRCRSFLVDGPAGLVHRPKDSSKG